jgi:acetyl-CoA acyltransferase
MRDAVIVSAVRTAVGRANKGTLRSTRPDDFGAVAIQGALARVPQLDGKEIEDVIFGCAMPEAEQGANVARILALRAGLPIEVSGMTVNRFCASGLQAIAIAAERIAVGGAEVIVAGGVESMTMVPMGGNKPTANPTLAQDNPGVYFNMGLTAERVAKHYEITRVQADEFSVESHRKAVRAIQDGVFVDEIVPVTVTRRKPAAAGKGATACELEVETIEFKQDECPRAETTLEALAALKPCFHAKGVVTAGNSSPTNDGAAAAVLMSAERAKALGLKPMARFVSFASVGCDPTEMGIGPVYAIPKALKLAGLKLDQIGVIELNEAFAAQALAVIKKLGLDAAKINPNGGAIALGHPLGCTGAKLTATLLRELKQSKQRYGIVSMCIGGGMGAAGIFENLS